MAHSAVAPGPTTDNKLILLGNQKLYLRSDVKTNTDALSKLPAGRHQISAHCFLCVSQWTSTITVVCIYSLYLVGAQRVLVNALLL